MKIHFMTPCYGGNISEVTFSSYLQWTILAMQNDLAFSIDTLSNESNVNPSFSLKWDAEGGKDKTLEKYCFVR